MKKVTKMKLSEMAKKMSVLTTQEQMEYTGGAVYFGLDGTYLGKLGDSAEMRIVNFSTFNGLSGCNDDSELWPHSVALNAGTSNELKLSALNSMALNIGISGGIQMDYLRSGVNGQYNATTNIITMSYGASNFNTGANGSNYFDFLMSLYHEKNHMDTFDPSDPKAKDEFDAYSDVLGRPEFEYCSKSYQSGMRYYHKLYRKQITGKF